MVRATNGAADWLSPILLATTDRKQRTLGATRLPIGYATMRDPAIHAGHPSSRPRPLLERNRIGEAGRPGASASVHRPSGNYSNLRFSSGMDDRSSIDELVRRLVSTETRAALAEAALAASQSRSKQALETVRMEHWERAPPTDRMTRTKEAGLPKSARWSHCTSRRRRSEAGRAGVRGTLFSAYAPAPSPA